MRSASWVNFILGLWLIVAPFALGYSPQMGSKVANDVIVGIVVLVLALVRAVGVGRRLQRPA